MNENNHEKIIDIVSKILLVDKEEITEKISRKDFEAWDSMTHLVIISELEQNFDIILEDDDITAMNTISDIKSILTKYEISF
ncbi:MAG: acyl carrier protein [Candidatus Heimdallarchaeota archaeon]|nr:acyl carrier protein [Candidatus Heimdallarchaeota archaeon]MBY8994006.1 acyl carrier protein [Candidatus Heimdallarchaeota archaeon]